MDCLCEEVNDTLQEVGQMSIATLSKNFGLPNDFLVEVCMYSTSRKYISKVLEQKTRLDAEIFLRLDASGCFIFYAQTHARGRTQTQKRACRQMQTNADKCRQMQTNADTCKIFQLHSLSKLLYV